MSIYLLGALVAASIALIAYALWPRGDSKQDTIKRRMKGGKAQQQLQHIRQHARESVAKRFMKTVAPIAVRPVMLTKPEEMSRLRMKLATAGFRNENATTSFLASKSILAVLLGAAGVTYAVAKGDSVQGAAGLVIFCAAIGFMAPNLWLSMAASKRIEKVRDGLPDSLDMLVICVESGLGLDAAFQRVGDEMTGVHPVLAEELQIVTLESQMGIPRSEALENVCARTNVPELKSLVAIINQTERFGTSISKALRNQSDALRVKRRQAAEERAQSTTVKLMAPLILFIFPAILVVLAGPAALSMIETLGNTTGL
ncbi:MAG: type II secretion system F family protein [Phycisphaerae bacterium]